ncbi:MAG: sugar phosphate isomerase/epimerase [Clostridia bacterium]|nr:sugar phosphate isomerase/epimerase [Clostridia bacterium]
MNKIGIIFALEDILNEKTDELFAFGLETVQLRCWHPENLTMENAEKVKTILAKGNLVATSVWGGWSGPSIWDFVSGPKTLGLVPEDYRFQRMQELRRAVDFTVAIGAKDMATHMGFIPEQPCYEGYRGLVEAVKWVGTYAKSKGVWFNFETGQETPTTLMRTIADTGLDNLGVNLDPANLIMYGRANPVDAVGIYGDKVRGVHLKDGNYPTGDFSKLGRETKVGEGSVNYPAFINKLVKEQGYTGDLYIEREISGAQQIADIKDTIVYIKELLK